MPFQLSSPQLLPMYDDDELGYLSSRDEQEPISSAPYQAKQENRPSPRHRFSTKDKASNSLSAPAASASPNSTTKKKSPAKSVMKGIDPKLDLASSRRARTPVAYNLKELVHRTYPTQNSVGKRHQRDSLRAAVGSSDRSINRLKRGKLIAHKPSALHKDRHKTQKTRHTTQKSHTDSANNTGRPSKRKRVNSPVPSSSESSGSEGKADDTSTPKLAYQARLLVDKLAPQLKLGGVDDPHEYILRAHQERFSKFTSLPSRRDLDWRPEKVKTWRCKNNIDIVALLVQVTGDVTNQPCTKCAQGSGLFESCVVMSSKIGHPQVYGCANCLYGGKQTYCSFKRKRPSVNTEIDPISPPSTKPATTQATSLVTSGTHPHGLTMEAWEKAPGCIRSKSVERPENIAFSKSYLATGQEVQACRSASFRVEVVRSGHIYQIKAKEDVTRLCSIAAGKLTVTMDGEESFVIGPHGMFRVKPGSACRCDSDTYEDVVLHVTSISSEN